MADTTFSPGTIISSTWLNDINDTIYQGYLTGPKNILLDGADNTGAVDATTIINSAISTLAAADGGVVWLPAGTYLALDIVLQSNVSVIGLGNVTIQKNGGTDETHCMYGYGTLGTATALTANCVETSLSCAVTSASGFTEGGYAVLRTNQYVSGSAGRNQEIVRITDITGLTITFDRPTIATYNTADSAELVPLIPLENVTVAGIKFVSTITVGGNVGGHIDVQYGVNVNIHNNEFYNAGGDAAVRFITCYRSRVHHNQFYDGQNMSAGGYGYGIEFDEATLFCSADNNFSSNIREHTFTNRTRYCTFSNNIMTGHYDTGFNTHGASVSHCEILDNVVNGTSIGAGIAVGWGSHGAGDSYITVQGNSVSNIASFGISSNAPVGKENSNIRIVANRVYSYGVVSVSAIGIYCNYSNYCEILNNTVRGINTNADNGIYVKDAVEPFVNGNRIFDLPNGYGITIDNVTEGVITNNRITDISSYNVRCLNTSTSTICAHNDADDTTNLFLSGVTQRRNSWNIFTGSATYDPPSLVDGAGTTTTISVTGVAVGDFARASFSLDTQGITITAWVSATNTVSVRFQNESGSTLDIASGTLKVEVVSG